MRNLVGALVCYSKWLYVLTRATEPRSHGLLRVAEVGAKCLPGVGKLDTIPTPLVVSRLRVIQEVGLIFSDPP